MNNHIGPSPYISIQRGLNLWQLGITELTGHNIEAKGREKVNEMLEEGWVLLHVYTLRHEENNMIRERPMAILGKPKNFIPDWDIK